jgi:hypothetical protein
MTIDAQNQAKQNSRSSNPNNSIIYYASNNSTNSAPPSISSSHCDTQSRHDTVYPNCDLDHPVNPRLFYDYTSPCYGIPFFINERKTHSELNRFVFKPLASMTTVEIVDTMVGDNFFNRLRR